jgi:hypothetical protein
MIRVAAGAFEANRGHLPPAKRNEARIGQLLAPAVEGQGETES